MTVKRISLFLAPALALAVGLGMAASGWPPIACWTAAVTLVTALWWIFEPIPIPATSLLPLSLFPIFGVLSDEQVAQAYGHRVVLLLLGGFILSAALERHRVHLRLAMFMVRLMGGHSDKMLCLAFMIAAAMLSMWISNTATALVMLPIVLAILREADNPDLALPLLLGIAFAASVGGLGTPVGTPPNAVMIGVYEEMTGGEIAFFEWMMIGVPCTLVLLPMIWLWLTRRLTGKTEFELPALGEWRAAEVRVVTVFAITALLWITRKYPFGGWVEWLSPWLNLANAHDGYVALAAVVALFLIPAGTTTDGRQDALLDWNSAKEIPWGILLLFGGGIAIASAFQTSGISEAIGHGLAAFTVWPVILMILALCLVVTFLTEVTSNTATTALLMPILAAAAIETGVDPRLLMIPAAISASCAFMLPVATAPNAIVYGTNQFTVAQMAREGIVLNVIAALLLTVLLFFLL